MLFESQAFVWSLNGGAIGISIEIQMKFNIFRRTSKIKVKLLKIDFLNIRLFI